MRLRILGLIIILFIFLGILAIVFFTNSDPNEYNKKDFKSAEKGINVAFFQKIEESDMKQIEQTLDTLKDIGVTHISIVLFMYQDNKSSIQIYEDPDKTLPKNQLIDYIRVAKEKGFKLQLRPFLELSERNNDSVGRWSISPSNVDKWFASYGKEITKYAEIAQAEKVGAFGIGSEMNSLSGKTDQWQNLIKKVRSVYRGEILYAVNWDDFTEGYFEYDLGWLKNVDIIGVDAYFPLKTQEKPSVEELQNAWRKWEKTFARLGTSGKKIIVSEIGIASSSEHFDEPWKFNFQYKDVDLLAQEKYYEASFKFFQNKVEGIYWWVIDDGLPSKNPEIDKGFGPLGKPAEGVLRKWYKADYN